MKKKPLTKVLGVILSAALAFGSIPAGASPAQAGEVTEEAAAASGVPSVGTGNEEEGSDQGSNEPAQEPETDQGLTAEDAAEDASGEVSGEEGTEEEGTEEDAGIDRDLAAGDNVYPASTKGSYTIQAVYSGGSRSGQYDRDKISITNVDKKVNINTRRAVTMTAIYSGNAGNSLISGMSHVPSSANTALYQPAGSSCYNCLYSSFTLAVPTGYKIAGVSYSGYGSRGNGLYKLYINNSSLKFNTTDKTWAGITADELTTGSAQTGTQTAISVRSMVDAFYSAGVGTTSSTYANAHGSVTQSITISPVQYTLVYNANGGTGAPAAQTMTYDTAAALQAAQPSRTGYRFSGWSIGGVAYSAGQALTPAQVSSFSSTQGAAVTAAAVWTPVTYTAAYDLDGGTGAASNHSVTYGTTFQLPAAPVKTGYTFAGWRAGNNITYAAGQTVQAAAFSSTQGATATFKAVWNPNTYTIRYDLQGGKSADGAEEQAPTVFTYDVEGTLAPAPTRDGFTFKGWRINGAVYSEGQSVKNLATEGELTAEAQWDEVIIIPVPTPPDNYEGPTQVSDETVNKILEAIQNGSAFQLKIDGTDYTIVRNEDGTLSIKVASIPAGTQVLKIPSEVKIGENVYTITEIYKECFKGNTDLKEVTVGNNITKIGDSAFEGCTNLKKVSLAEGLVTIGNRAFEGCSSLTSIRTPGTLQTIGDYAFRNCVSLKTVTLNNGLLTIGSYAFYNCRMVAKIAIPDTVLKIGKYAFGKCVKLKTVTTSKSCTTMGDGVFSDCSALTKITLKSALRAVPKKAFYGCKKLTAVKMGNKVATIGANAFQSCTALKSVKLSASLTTIGKQAFMGCKKLSSVTLPGKVMSVKEKAFYNCSSLKKVTVKSKVLSSVGRSAFKKCRKNIVFSVPDAKVSAYSRLLKGKY